MKTFEVFLPGDIAPVQVHADNVMAVGVKEGRTQALLLVRKDTTNQQETVIGEFYGIEGWLEVAQ